MQNDRTAIAEHLLEEMTIAEAIERWPQIAPLFLRRRLACFGCDMAGFCSLGDIGAYYAHVDLPALLAELRNLVEDGPGS